MLEMLKIKQLPAEIDRMRTQVTDQLLKKSSNINSTHLTAISTSDLQLLFNLYDEAFFENWFRDNFKGKMKFSLSRKMTRSAGKTMCPKNIGAIRPEELVLEIRIGIDFFLLNEQVGKSNIVCGLKAGSNLEALQLVFEHELCHVIEFLLFHKSSCKYARFKTMANNIFGHTDSYHKLPTHKQIAGKMYGFKIGDTVSFEYKQKRLTGLLYSIHKRAAVLVPDKNGVLVDRRGIRYTKYYVPLPKLNV